MISSSPIYTRSTFIIYHGPNTLKLSSGNKSIDEYYIGMVEKTLLDAVDTETLGQVTDDG